MTIRPTGYIITLVLVVILAVFSTASIVSLTDPASSSFFILFCFYASVFLSVAGIGTLLGLGIRRYLTSEYFAQSFLTSIRQGILLAILVVVSLLLQADTLLYWWVELSLVLFLLVVEVLFNI